jgi:hypothetical protein
MPANDDIIDSHKGGDCGNSKDDWKGGKSRGDKREPGDVGLARPPITIKERRSPFPVDVSGTMGTARGLNK